MTSGLAWLNELMVWLGRWVPRLTLIEATHHGVLFGPRGSAREIPSGLLAYWPITHTLTRVPITTQSIQLSGQVLRPLVPVDSLVPHVTVCAAAVQFRVADALKSTRRALNLHALVDNRGQAAISRNAHLQGDVCAWSTAIREQLAVELYEFGVALEAVDFTQVGTGVAIKQVESGNWSDNVDGTRPTQ